MNLHESPDTSTSTTPFEPLLWCRTCSTNLIIEAADADHGVWNAECPSCHANIQVVL